MEARHQAMNVSSLRDLLVIVFKHKYKILAVFFIVGFGVAVWAKLRPVQYEAKASLLLKFGREFIKTSEVGSDRFTLPPDAVVNTEIKILTSKELLAKVVSTVGLETIMSDPAKPKTETSGAQSTDTAVARIEKALEVRPQGNSGVIEMTFTHRDPKVAVAVLKAICDHVRERHLEIFGGNSTPFLEQQMADYEDKLTSSRKNLETFRQKHQIFSLEEQRTLLIQQRGADAATLTAAQNQVKELEQNLAFVKSPRWVPDASRDASAQVLALEQRERDTLERYTENSSAVQNIRSEIQAAKASASRGIENARRVEISRIEGELNGARTRADGIRQRFGQVDRDLRTLDTQEKDYQKLRLDVTANENNYQNYLRKLEEAHVSDSMDRQKMANISIMEQPWVNATPKMKGGSTRDMALLGMLAGLVCGVAVAFALEVLSPSMTTPLAAEHRLGLPVLVAVTRK